jgi:hypothetical protein
MASPASPPPVKLICGMISSRRELLAEARGELEKLFGPVDIASEIMDFDFTHYYDEEMGAPLLRQFVSFAELAAPESLVEAKHATNALEQAFAGCRGLPRLRGNHATPDHRLPLDGCPPPGRTVAAAPAFAEASAGENGAANHGSPLPRPINLDPGYVDSPKLVLASMKNYAHRIYLGRGVYAEVTLLHRRGQWTALEWTFPDYASGRYGPFLDQARKRLRDQLGSENHA